jgi:hypothetical protein
MPVVIKCIFQIKECNSAAATSTEHSNSTYNNHVHVDLKLVLHPCFETLVFRIFKFYFLK